MLPMWKCCRNRPLRGFATRGEANTPNEVSAEFPIGNWYWYWQHFHNGNIYKCLSWSEELELESGTTDLHGQGFAYARPFVEWILENAMRKFLVFPM